jgi:nitroreductase
MNFSELAAARHSVRHYQPGLTIDDATLTSIFEDVLLSPSSFNLQHWSFVVVRDAARKQALRAVSFGQAQVEDSAAAILVCGRLDAFEDAPRIYEHAPEALRAKALPTVSGFYTGKPEAQHEEAVRSASLAAMALMFAAKARGWDTGPMIGFDAPKVSALLELDAQTVPVMLVVLGKALNGEQPARLYRRPIAEVVKLETAQGSGLG